MREPVPIKSSGNGNCGNKANKDFLHFNEAKSAPNSNTAKRVTQNGLEVEGLLPQPVGPTSEDLGCDQLNDDITCMDYIANFAAVVIPNPTECFSAGASERRGTLSLKKWKRAARSKVVGVNNGHSHEPKLGKRKGDVGEVGKKLPGREEKKLKGVCEYDISNNLMVEAGCQPRQSP
jgi:hypothetical protein